MGEMIVGAFPSQMTPNRERFAAIRAMLPDLPSVEAGDRVRSRGHESTGVCIEVTKRTDTGVAVLIRIRWDHNPHGYMPVWCSDWVERIEETKE